MAPSLASSTASLSESDRTAVWHNLVQAIASSSGFECWLEQQPSAAAQPAAIDLLVRRYLRETLETLAY
ncbi:MAG: hypothetical protein EA001_09805 [Oscillatoriales cyanobacterium]|nr:MAG: hypothetical protein EA001_09805 [Oscillatoriales cyanobacterium]